MRLMILEDDALVGELLALKLGAVGFAVSVPPDMAAARVEIARQPPDILMLDADMSGVEVLSVLKSLRATPHGAQIRVLVMGAGAAQPLAQAARDAGAAGYLAKPFSLDALMYVVDRMVRDRALAWIDDRQAISDQAFSAAAATAATPKAKALIVEDVEINRELLSMLLLRGGFAVEAVSDAESALSRLSEQEYSVVVMDMRLPGMTGGQAIRAIRAAGSSVSILAMSACALQRNISDALDCGADAFLRKPFTEADLRAAVDLSLDAHRSAA